MNVIAVKGMVRAAMVFAVSVALNGGAMAAYDFGEAWRAVAEAQEKGLPRTVTNKVDEIAREAAAAARWPDAARAFLVREKAMQRFTDELPQDWLPAFAASVDEQPAQLQAVLQLHLAHTYHDNSLRWRWGGAAPTKLDDAAAAEKMPPWSPEKIAATLEAQFAKVFARAEELKGMKLSDWTAIFERGRLPESYAPTLFDFAVRDAIRFYGETIPDKTLEKGIALYDRLIDFHRSDENPDARAMAEIGRAEYVRNFDDKPDSERVAAFAAFLDGFIERYGEKTEAVAYAAALRAEILQKTSLLAAHDLAARYEARWPDSPGGKKCGNIVAAIERKSLEVKVERNWCSPWPEIEVNVANVPEVHFRLVPVTFGELVSDTSMGASVRGTSESEVKNTYLKRRPAKEWKEGLPLKPDYTKQTFKFPVPSDLKSGHYVLFVAGNGAFGADKQPLLAQYVTVTTLALALKTGNGAFGGAVYRAESGETVEGATVELWGYPPKGGRIQALREKYVTDKDGRFVADVTKKDDYNALVRHVRVVKDGDEVLSLGSEGSGSEQLEAPRYEHMDIFTDRSIYRPGQAIFVKGIAYHANPHTQDFHTLPDELVLVTLSDPNGKEVAAKRLRTNRWGSFTYRFTAPTGRLTGEYTVMARVVPKGGVSGETKKRVSVEEYKRPKFTASFEGAPEHAMLGEPVTVKGRALTYSGLPVQNAKVRWSVERATRYPGWWRWFGGSPDDDGENFVGEGEVETDGNGEFAVTFTPVAAKTADLSGDPSFEFTVTAEVTDETGEERTATESFEIGTVAWRASVWTADKWQTPEKPVDVRVSLSSFAGAPLPVVGKLKACRLVAPEKPVRKPAGEGRYGYDRFSRGPWDWKTWETGEEVLSLDVSTEKPEKWKGEINLSAGAYRLAFEAKDPNGKTAKDYAEVCVFDPSAKGLGIAMPQFFQTERGMVKVGETLRAYWGTGYASGRCHVKVTNNGKTILEKTVGGECPSWFYELPIKEENRGEVRIATTFVRENRIYCNDTSVNVPWDNKYLDITAEHLTSKLNPGNEETWTFKVSGPSEVLAFMYDRSLDAYRWHDVSLGFSDHFTPWTRYLVSPSIQNAIRDMYFLGGQFPGKVTRYADLVWPSWKRMEYGSMRGVRARGVAMMCESAPAGAVADAECVEMERVPAVDGGASMKGKDDRRDAPPRTNLKETAFFFPSMETDADGKVSFTFTVPDALTGWKLLMVAHDNDLRHGVFRNDKIVTTKPLMCEPNAPRFAREGDDFLFAVKVTNTEDGPQSGEVSLALEELSGVKTRFDIAPQSFSLAPHESKAFEFPVRIPDGCGFLKYVARAKGSAFADGEEGVLPVLARRVMVREAVQLNVRGAGTKSFRFENLLASKGSDTIRHQDLTVRAVSRPAWYAVLSLPYLMEFPHECCEQTFSRCYANALGAHIANSDPRIRATFDAWKAAGGETLKSPLEANANLKTIALESTPWIREAEHESVARARLGELFGAGRLAEEQAKCIEKLRLARSGDGLWPWFPGGPSSAGITLYILSGFARLNFMAGTAYPDFFASAVEALDREVSEDVKRRLKDEKERGVVFRVSGFDIRWLYLHSFKGVATAKDPQPTKLFIKHLREEWTEFSLGSQALAAIALKRCGEERLAKEIMASIKERGVLSDEFGMYWKRSSFFSCSVFAAPVSTQALIIEAFREVTGDEDSAEACNVWLLKQKQTQDWTTTAATADAIYALLLGGGADLLAGDRLAEVTLAGEKVPVVDAEAGTGMYSHRYAGPQVRPEMGEITFTGAGEKGVAWGGVHWTYFEDVLKVRAHEPKELRIEKKYYKKTKGAEGTRLSSIDGVLEPGDEIVARLEITSDRTYEFVHIQDERPACAEPEDVLSSYRWRDGVGYYQSTRDTATHYYIDRLNKGVFVLETSYRVQQRGVFVGGLATIQCMYAPEFTAHSTAETVRVKVEKP